MKRAALAARILAVSVFTGSQAHAQSIDLATMQLQLDTIESEIHDMSLQLGEMAKDLKGMKECAALARQTPLSLAELRRMAKPASKADDANVVDLYRKDTVARLRCGLTPKL